jgi:hypothetical protein
VGPQAGVPSCPRALASDVQAVRLRDRKRRQLLEVEVRERPCYRIVKQLVSVSHAQAQDLAAGRDSDADADRNDARRREPDLGSISVVEARRILQAAEVESTRCP